MSRLTIIVALSIGLHAAGPRKVTDADVRKVHRSASLIDGHNDVTSATVEGLDLGARRNVGHTDIPRMKEGGMAAQFFAAYVGAGHIDTKTAAHRALQMIDTIRYDIVERHIGEMSLALRASDIGRIRKSGRIAALIGVEGGHSIEEDLRLLRTFYDLGVRYMTLTHTRNLTWAGSSGDAGDVGLSDFGRRVIAEMNRLGMMVDIAHVSDRTFWNVIETSTSPVFSSHSSCRALSNIPRNMTDDMIRAVAKRGGLVMINLGCEFLSQKSADSSPWGDPGLAKRFESAVSGIEDPQQRRTALRKLLAEAELKTVRATMDDVVAHLDHIRKIAGVDAIGLGSDFDGVSCAPQGLDDVSKWPNLTRALLERGYPAGDIRKIYGGNLLRFMRAVERAAARR